jgi:DNA-binding beta-propeller fold protein YncE
MTFIAATLLSALLCMVPAASQAKDGDASLHRIDILHVPGRKLTSFDASVVDRHGSVFALADRSNRGVDLFDAHHDRFLGRVAGFTGFNAKHGSAFAGPNGLVTVGSHQIWAGNGNSTVKIIDTVSRQVIGTVSTGGTARVDEIAYDSHDHLVVAANNVDKPAFLTFISTLGAHEVLGRTTLPQATDGLEQPVWDPVDDLVYVAVPELDGAAAQGGIVVIDAHTRKVLRIIQVEQCVPAGLAIGPNEHALVGCSDDAIAAGFPAKSLILDLRSGKVVSTMHQVGGSDEVWFDKQQDRYYLAAVANPGGPVLGVVDARDDRWLANVPTGPHAHSVAADPVNGRVFVPIAATDAQSDCRNGCIAVFAAPSSH